MENEFVLLPEKSLTHTAKSVLANLGILCAGVTLCVAAVLLFTDISFEVAGTYIFSPSFLLLLFAGYVMYFSMASAGRERASSEPGYRKQKETLEGLLTQYRLRGSRDSLSAFCRKISARETDEKINGLLLYYGITREDMEKGFAADQKITRRQKKGLRRVKRCEGVTVAPSMLLSGQGVGLYAPPLSAPPEKTAARRIILYMLPTSLTAFFSVSVVCSVILKPTAGEWIGYLLKLFTLVFNGIKGYEAGYFHIAKDKKKYRGGQIVLWEEYFKDLGLFPASLQKEGSQGKERSADGDETKGGYGQKQ
ncbi:MAG: hypothetical protein MJ078_01515 [Clostridia bacterium]|nr:hypothetical protein [Clostridia bacterium]